MYKVGFYIFKYGFYTLIFSCILVCAILFNKVLETALTFASYVVLRPLFPKTWHSNNFYKCIFISISSWCLVVMFIPLPIHMSVLINVVLGFAVGYVLYLVKDYLDLKHPPKNLRNITIDELKVLCEKFNISELGFNRLKLRYIDKMTMKEIAHIENIEVKSVEMFFARIRERLKLK